MQFSFQENLKNILKPPSLMPVNRSSINIIPKNQQQNLDRALNDLNWDNLTSCQDADICTDAFLMKIKEVILSFSRRGCRRHRKSNSLPWLTPDCLKLMKLRDRLLLKSLKSGLITDRQNFTAARN